MVPESSYYFFLLITSITVSIVSTTIIITLMIFFAVPITLNFICVNKKEVSVGNNRTDSEYNIAKLSNFFE